MDTSFLSGNTLLLGQALGQGNLARCAAIAVIIDCFVAGTVVSQVLAEWTGHRHAAVVTGFVAVLLALAAMHPAWEIDLAVLAMGALNASMNHIGSVSVIPTYATGSLVKFGQGLGRGLCCKVWRRFSAAQFLGRGADALRNQAGKTEPSWD